MISERNNWHGRAIILIILMMTVVLLNSLAMARQTEDIDDEDFPVRKSSDSGGIYNQYARFIAGMSVQKGALAELQSKPAWVEYSRYFDQNWKNLSRRLFVPERDWADKELGAVASSERTVFYPFSGPDFANVNAFFPRARTYVLMALEPLGEIPKFPAMNDGQLRSWFNSMKNSLHDLLNINYFISDHMDAEIEKTEVKGVLPVLLFMLARNNAEVLEVNYWTMGMDGRVRELPALGTTAKEFPALATSDLDMNYIHGIRISFKSADSEEKQTLYYLRVNLYNQAFDRNGYFLNFLRRMAPFTTFTKSASYVMHMDKVSTARKFMLDMSRYIIQDDSGIPLRHFEQSLWNMKFYGHYVKPISAFSQNYQERLASVYREDKRIKSLPFGFGYYYKPGESNLMFAEKKFKDRRRDEAPFDNADKHFLYNFNTFFQRGQWGS